MSEGLLCQAEHHAGLPVVSLQEAELSPRIQAFQAHYCLTLPGEIELSESNDNTFDEAAVHTGGYSFPQCYSHPNQCSLSALCNNCIEPLRAHIHGSETGPTGNLQGFSFYLSGECVAHCSPVADF